MKLRERFIALLKENKIILIVMLVLLIERLYILFALGPQYTLNSDDAEYVESGVEFARSGKITYCGVITAQIMPAMTVFIGLLSMIFGTGSLLWLVLKLCWITMGVFTAFFIYKVVGLFAPKWCGIVASLFLLLPNFIWMDNLLLTETPFIFLMSATVYFTLMMEKTGKWKYFWFCAVTYMLAFMLKANFALYPIFALIYLLLSRYDRKKLIKQCICLACVVLCFVIPWSIRNYCLYDRFIPLTCGVGNPMLLGSYQGEGAPDDASLDYDLHVEKVLKEQNADYYNEDGSVKKDYYEAYLSLKHDEIKAKYRISVWLEENPLNFAKTYLYEKPRQMIEDVFYWQGILDVQKETLVKIRKIDFYICCLGLLAAFLLKKRRSVISFLWLLYLGNIYLYSLTSFAFDRYAETVSVLRYMLVGISLYLIILLGIKIVQKVRAYDRQAFPSDTQSENALE